MKRVINDRQQFLLENIVRCDEMLLHLRRIHASFTVKYRLFYTICKLSPNVNFISACFITQRVQLKLRFIVAAAAASTRCRGKTNALSRSLEVISL
ncbi:hypothetical protein FKM82_013719 [Ascaphus truei]